MKPHPRIRKTIKHGGAAVTVLLVFVWIGSGWFTVGCQVKWDHLWVDGGTLKFGTLDSTYGHGWMDTSPKTRAFMSWHRWAWEPIGSISVNQGFPRWEFPVCFLCVISLAMTLPALFFDWRARRRARLNLCPKCNYDRTGLAPSAGCPECGTSPT